MCLFIVWTYSPLLWFFLIYLYFFFLRNIYLILQKNLSLLNLLVLLLESVILEDWFNLTFHFITFFISVVFFFLISLCQSKGKL